MNLCRSSLSIRWARRARSAVRLAWPAAVDAGFCSCWPPQPAATNAAAASATSARVS